MSANHVYDVLTSYPDKPLPVSFFVPQMSYHQRGT